jgi:hypothetical protein
VLRHQDAVAGQRQVAHPGDVGKHAHQHRELPAHQRLAAGEAHLLHAEAREDAYQPGDLLEGEQLRARQEGVVAAEELAWHAVDTAEVASVRDADPQVAQRASTRVEWEHGEWLGHPAQMLTARAALANCPGAPP